MRHRWMDRKTEGKTKRTDFIGPFPWSFYHVLWKFENKIFLNYLALL